MPFSFVDPDWKFPPELQNRISEAVGEVTKVEWKRLHTPVEGGMSGGFPGFNPNHKKDLVAARKAAIDQWNAENPEG